MPVIKWPIQLKILKQLNTVYIYLFHKLFESLSL